MMQAARQPYQGAQTKTTMPMTVDEISRMSRREVDQLFAKGEVGPIPEGNAKGRAIFVPGKPTERISQEVVRWLLWQGKIVDSKRQLLKNKILPLSIPAIAADVYWDQSWFDGRDCIVLDYSKRSTLARYIRDEIRRVAPGLYLGLVYWGPNRILYFTLQFGSHEQPGN